jgi:hypothetical protein
VAKHILELERAPFMDLVIIAISVFFLLLAAGFAAVFARLISRDRVLLPLVESDPIFSPNRYRMVERLLAEADLQSVECVGGKRVERESRKVRVKIFRGYLLQLSEDFDQICKTIRLLMVTSEVDRSQLSGVILKQQFQFSLRLMRIEVELILYSLGYSGIATTGLTESLEALRLQLQGLIAVAEPMAA